MRAKHCSTARPDHVGVKRTFDTMPPSDSNCTYRWLNRYADLLPVHLSHPERYPFLLESVARGTDNARYDFLFAFPQGSLALWPEGGLRSDVFRTCGQDFLHNLDLWWNEHRNWQPLPSELPFCGGWFVYFGYELAAQIEPVLSLPCSEEGLPIAAAYRMPAAIIRDHQLRRTTVVAELKARELVPIMEEDLLQAPELERQRGDILQAAIREEPEQLFLSRLAEIQAYILEGDVFQVNLSRRWQGLLRPDLSHGVLYDRLRQFNPAPFAALANFGDAAILSSSPERLARVRGGVIETRPIAGTHPRSRNDRADRILSRALLANPKERSEHTMLIDLERNDLGRVCQVGSVTVPEFMILESYPHVHHIVSTVCGRLRREVTPGDVVRAIFPGGTITGCPKIRCMQIIAALEAAPRGPYTGAMGYLGWDGSMDFNILIRTLIRREEQIWLRTGAGIVADSVPELELRETRHKAEAALRALTKGM
ncbi:MAG: aminodeoxychorismate synthase component I [Gammaproteobacteria bacterium]